MSSSIRTVPPSFVAASFAVVSFLAACGAEGPTAPAASPDAEAPAVLSAAVGADAAGFDPPYWSLGIVDPVSGLVCIARPTPADGTGGGTKSHQRFDVEHRTTHDATASVRIHVADPIPGSPGAYQRGVLLYSGTGRMTLSAWGVPGSGSFRTSAIVKATVTPVADPTPHDAVCQIVEGPVLHWTHVSVAPAKGKGPK